MNRWRKTKRTARGAIWLLPATIVLLAAAGGYYLLAPHPPALKLAGADPAVVRQLSEARRTVYLMPWSAQAWGRLGALCYVYDFYEAADVCLARATARDPTNPRWVYLRGRTLGDQNPDPALPILARAAELCGDRPQAPHLKYGELLVERGRLDEAEAQFRRILDRVDSEDPRALLGMGRVALARGQLEPARRFLEQSAQRKPDVKATHTFLAQIYQRQNDPRDAQLELRLAAKCPETALWDDPYLGEALGMRVGKKVEMERADAELRKGALDSALAKLRQLSREYPDAPEVFVHLSVALVEKGELSGAEQAARTSIALAPQSADPYNQLGNVLFARGQFSEAQSQFGKASQYRPDEALFRFNQGMCLLRLSQPREAQQMFTIAVRLKPDLAVAYTRQGEAQLRQGLNSAAIESLRQALQLDPDDAAAQTLLQEAQSATRPSH